MNGGAHTPGPWKATFHRVMPGTPVQMYWLNDMTSIGTQNAAAARLCAAAPELLAALREVLDTLGPDAFTNAVVRAQAAIRKAEGRS